MHEVLGSGPSTDVGGLELGDQTMNPLVCVTALCGRLNKAPCPKMSTYKSLETVDMLPYMAIGASLM